MKHLLSYWERTVLLRPFDFVILGAGLTGKQIAIKIKLKYPKARIAIVDRSAVSYGASTRNAGFACFGSISEILDDFRLSTENDVMNLAAKRYNGIMELVDTFGPEAIGFRPTGSYELFTGNEELSLAKNHLERINSLFSEKIGLKDVFSLRLTGIFGMNCEEECIFNPYEGMLNPGMLNEMLSSKAHQLGIIPLYGLDIKTVEKGNKCYSLMATNGIEINGRQLIIANNAFAAPFLPNEDIRPARGQIIITKPIPDLPFDGVFFADKGYIYFRTVDGRVLIGGGRNHFMNQENTFEFEGSLNLKQYLEDYLRNIVLPGRNFETDMHWSGIMAMGKEKIPIVKRVDENLLVCVRMGGMGVALGPVLSREIVELI